MHTAAVKLLHLSGVGTGGVGRDGRGGSNARQVDKQGISSNGNATERRRNSERESERASEAKRREGYSWLLHAGP